MLRSLAGLGCLAVVLTAAVPSSTANAKVIAAPPRLPRVATLDIPGDPAFVALARDVIAIVFTVDPSGAASAGLFDDAATVPSFSPSAIAALVTRLDADVTALRALPWRRWPIDQQLDARWIAANAETVRHQLVDERIFTHRPAAWLEPLANTLIALTSYVPAERDRTAALWGQVPAMVHEMDQVATDVTTRDRTTARQLIGALRTMATRDGSPRARSAIKALRGYDLALAAMRPSREFDVIGAEGFAWRLAHAELLTASSADLLAAAHLELARVDAELKALTAAGESPVAPSPQPTKAEQVRARALTGRQLLDLYDAVELGLRQATLDGDWVSIPAGVGSIRARATPDAMVPE